MVTKRNFWLVLLLGIVTFGLYVFYHMYTVTRDVNQMADGDGEEMNPGMVIILSIVTCGFYVFWWYYKIGNRIQTSASTYNVPMAENGTTYILWIVLGSMVCGIGSLIAQFLFIKNFNVLVDAYNGSSRA